MGHNHSHCLCLSVGYFSVSSRLNEHDCKCKQKLLVSFGQAKIKELSADYDYNLLVLSRVNASVTDGITTGIATP